MCCCILFACFFSFVGSFVFTRFIIASTTAYVFPGRGRGGLVNGESRPVHTSDNVETTEQTSATTSPEPTKPTTPAVEPQPAIPSKPSFADILKKNVRKEEPEPKAAAPLPDDQHERPETTHRPKQQRPRREDKPPVQEVAPEKEEEEEERVEDVSEQLQQTPVTDVEGQKIESAAEGDVQIQKKEIENAAALAHTLQTAPAEKGAVPIVQTQQTQRAQHQVSAPQVPTSASEAANLILPPGSTEFLQSGGSLDLQFGSMGISDEQSHSQPQQPHATPQQHQSQQPQQQANYQMPPQMPQQPQFPPHYGWTGQQFGDQGYQNFFNQYGQPQQARPHQPQQTSGKDQPSEKQDETTKQAGYQQGSNKYVQPNPYAQMGSPQYAFPAQFGYPYMMPNAMQFQGYPQGYMPSSSKNYPFYGKQNLYGYQAYQGATGATGAQQGAYPPADEAQQTEYNKSLGYPYGGAPQQPQPHHHHHNPQQDQSKQQRGGNKPRRGDQSANPYAGGYGGYPGNVYGGGYMNYGPAGAYPASQGYQHPTTPYSQSGGGARQHQSGKDQDSQQQQQQQQQQPRQPTWNQY